MNKQSGGEGAQALMRAIINGYTYIWPIDIGKVVGVEARTGQRPLGAFV